VVLLVMQEGHMQSYGSQTDVGVATGLKYWRACAGVFMLC